MRAEKQIEFESELKFGLRNAWYPVCKSETVKAAPAGLHRLGSDIVVWRDSAGRIHVHDDRCLHRGAKLSVGQVVNNTLRCAYHGWCYDTSGQCVVIPTSKTAESKLAPRLRLQQFEAQERAGLVWVYFSEQSNPQVPPLVIPEELEDPAYSGFICEAEWGANWILILENLADPMHGPFLHGQSLTLSRGTLEDDMRTIRNDDGFVVERAGQRGVNFDWSEFYWRDSIWVRLDIPLPFGPKGILRILCFATPIDENRTLVYFLRYRKLSGWKRAYWRFLYNVFWEKQHLKVIEQDRVILESQRGAESRIAEHLSNSDRGVSELRKLLREKIACRMPQ
ncbi:MAG TPA: aromatic ring-hydroxylating dioxygenase subunit alpha [Terriglobia bacterium]|nr:aromatic ring-hydroxylating dioxygenase subunit alpha [Terriglobia bacterium]